MRCLLSRRDHRAHLHAGLQPVADHPPLRPPRRWRLVKGSARLADGDGQRSRQAALPGAAEGAVGQDARGHLQVGVRQDHDRVLGAALALGALAVGRRPAVDVQRRPGVEPTKLMARTAG